MRILACLSINRFSKRASTDTRGPDMSTFLQPQRNAATGKAEKKTVYLTQPIFPLLTLCRGETLFLQGGGHAYSLHLPSWTWFVFL
eukprot:g80885.t1